MAMINYVQSFILTISVLIWWAYDNTDEKSENKLPVNLLVTQGVLLLCIWVSILAYKWFSSFQAQQCSVWFIFLFAFAQWTIAITYFAVTTDSNSSEIYRHKYECSNVTFCSIGVMMSYINILQAVFHIPFLYFLYRSMEMKNENTKNWGNAFFEMINMLLIIQLFVGIIGYVNATTQDSQSPLAQMIITNFILMLFTVMFLSIKLRRQNSLKFKLNSKRMMFYVTLIATWILSLVYVASTFTTDMTKPFRSEYSCSNLTYCSAAVVMKILNFIFVLVTPFAILLVNVMNEENKKEEEDNTPRLQDGGAEEFSKIKIRVFREV